jgi:DNA-binding transcriptional regulator YiaG
MARQPRSRDRKRRFDVGLTREEVARLRLGLRLTQLDFAALVGVRPQQVSRWETGRSVVTLQRAVLIQRCVRGAREVAEARS